MQQSHIWILVILHELLFYAHILFYFIVFSFLIFSPSQQLNYFNFRHEINLELCVFTYIFQINRKLNFAQNADTDLLHSHDPLFSFEVRVISLHITPLNIKKKKKKKIILPHALMAGSRWWLCNYIRLFIATQILSCWGMHLMVQSWNSCFEHQRSPVQVLPGLWGSFIRQLSFFTTPKSLWLKHRT